VILIPQSERISLLLWQDYTCMSIRCEEFTLHFHAGLQFHTCRTPCAESTLVVWNTKASLDRQLYLRLLLCD
jgi:hypothetical protein